MPCVHMCMAHAARPPWVADVLMAAMSADEAGCTVHGNAITGYGLYTQDIGICIFVGQFFFFELGHPREAIGACDGLKNSLSWHAFWV
jgi:hypothetical protein